MIKVLTVVGTRPEAIKLAPLVLEFRRRPHQFRSVLCSTGQHRQMLDQVLSVFELTPDHDLNVMTPGQQLAELTARATMALDRVIADERPNVVLVQGDTTTAFCGALAAYYHKVRVGHVEAGLRTGDKYAPYPEEINRRLVTPLADYHFAPTDRARRALLAESVPVDRIFVTGNTVIDALLQARDRVRRERTALPAGLDETLDEHDVVLITGHRRESFGDGFRNICTAIREVADAQPQAAFVYPVHLNPNVQEPVRRILGGHDRIHLIEPQPYLSFVALMDRATVVLTDSGGVQEEAPSLGKPVLVMRETTERPEGIAAGNARLVGVNREGIARELLRLLRDPCARVWMTQARNPYGDGEASVRIADILVRH